jgi:hypothetical protein
VHLIRHAGGLLHQERRRHLSAIQDALAGFEAARVALLKALARMKEAGARGAA